MSALLELTGLNKAFGQVVVARDLDFRIEPGEVVGILGPNGAGKSTLFSLITGDLQPDSGSISFDGSSLRGQPAHLRCRAGIGRSYQVPRPFEKMTVFENVLVPSTQGARLRGRAANAHAADILQTCGLLPVANQPAGTLPLLQRKRLEMARALATSPKLLLLDEVAGGLTEPEMLELVELVNGLKPTGIAIVWIEHVVQALVQTVERMLCLAGGSFIADGLPAEVLGNPAVVELYFGGDAASPDPRKE